MERTSQFGYYGPRPEEIVSARELARFNASALICAHALRHLPQARRLSPIDEKSAGILKDCANRLRFGMRIPKRVPAGFAVASSAPSTLMGDAATVYLRRISGHAEFELGQRPAWLPTGELLSTARVPHIRVLDRGDGIYVVHGRHGGEPIDRSFWTTRQTVMFQSDGLALELREVRGRGPGLPTLLNYAIQMQNLCI